MISAIIGHTGFVGSNLIEQMKFKYMFNSKNINEISNHEYDLVICAGVPSPRWYANEHPKEDLDNIIKLINSLKDVKCKRFILISTIDVFEKTFDNPGLIKCGESHHPYGFNRYYAEEEIKIIFGDKLLIIRLPSVFGNNLKKNVLFDLLNDKIRGKINLCDEYQWYDVRDLSEDISITDSFKKEINFFSEPVPMKKIVSEFHNIDPNKLYYDCDSITKYDLPSLPNGNLYWTAKNTIIDKLKKFICEYGGKD